MATKDVDAEVYDGHLGKPTMLYDKLPSITPAAGKKNIIAFPLRVLFRNY